MRSTSVIKGSFLRKDAYTTYSAVADSEGEEGHLSDTLLALSLGVSKARNAAGGMSELASSAVVAEAY
jgi:hypothetical protein